MKRIIFIAAAALMLTGCKTKETVVTVIEHHTDTLIITKHQRDSIYLKDSTNVHEWSRNDTVFVAVTRWKTEYHDRAVHDTTYVSKTDSVPVPYPVTEYVERELTWWQHFRLSIANVVLYSLLIAAGIYLWRLYQNFQK